MVWTHIYCKGVSLIHSKWNRTNCMQRQWIVIFPLSESIWRLLQLELNPKSVQQVFYLLLYFYLYFNYLENYVCSLPELLLMNIHVEHLYCFLSDRDGQMAAWTIVNYSAVLGWHLVYLCYFLHPNSSSASKANSLIKAALCSKIEWENADCLCWMKEC